MFVVFDATRENFDFGESLNEAFQNLCDQLSENLIAQDCTFYKMVSVTIDSDIQELPQ